MKSKPELLIPAAVNATQRAQLYSAVEQLASAIAAVAARENANGAHVGPAPYVTVKLAATITGLTEKSIRRKIEEGKWLEGREWQRSPDGGIFISMKGYAAWVEGSGR